MHRKQKRISLFIGLAAGVLADGWLRLSTGEEGNLLVHSAVFLGCGLLAAGLIYALLLRKRN